MADESDDGGSDFDDAIFNWDDELPPITRGRFVFVRFKYMIPENKLRKLATDAVKDLYGKDPVKNIKLKPGKRKGWMELGSSKDAEAVFRLLNRPQSAIYDHWRWPGRSGGWMGDG